MLLQRYGLVSGLATITLAIFLTQATFSSFAQDVKDKGQDAKGKAQDTKCKDKAPAKQGKGKKGSATPATPEQLLADVRASKDFNVTIFAQHPDINYPTCICTTPDGKLFVGIDGNSAQGTAPNRGRVILCEDTKGTGKADKFTVFCKVDHPRGMVYLNGALYVNHPGDFSVFYDDNNDGVADRSELLVKDIAARKAYTARGADHSTNNITMGIDGWIYFAVGDQGMNAAVGKDGAKLSMRSGIARVRPDGTGLEAVLWGTRNIYGVAIDPYMNMFTRDNTNDGGGWNVRLNHDIPTAQYGYPSLFVNFADEIMPPLVDYGGGGPTGATFLDEPMLPAPYNNTLFTVDYGKHQIFRHILEPQGATFKRGTKQVEFLKITNPIDMEFDGMGRLYISSFRGAGFNYSNENTGYIARLTHKDVKPIVYPVLNKTTDAELVRFATGPSAHLRMGAQQEILRRGDKEEITKGLEKVAASDTALSGRVAALYTLKQLRGEKSHPALVQLAADAKVREFALKALADDKRKLDGVPVALFVNALKDPDPRVRMQAVIGLGRMGKKDVADQLIPMLDDQDPAIAHVAYRNLWILGAYETCLKALDSSSSPKVILGSTFALQLMHTAPVVDGLIQKLSQSQDTRVHQAAIRALARLYYDEKAWDGSWWGTRPATKGPYFQTVKWSESDKIADALSKAVKVADTPALAFLLQEVTRNNVPFAGKVELTIKLATTDAKYRSQAVTLLAGQSQLSPEGALLLQQIVREGKDPAAMQAKAINGLHAAAIKTKNLDLIVPVLATHWGSNSAAQVALARDAFIRDGALADHVDYFAKAAQDNDAKKSGFAYAVLLQLASNFQLPSGPRNQAGKSLEEAWTKPASTVALLKAIGDTKADECALQVKQFLNDKRPEVKEAATYAAKLIDLDALDKAKKGPTVGSLSYEDAVAAVLQEKGDATRGSRLFIKQGCILCHTISPLDTPKGPHLEDIGSKQKREELLESILKPSAKLAQGYESWIFTLTDGKMVTGFVVRETGDAIEVRNVGGISMLIPNADIDTRVRSEVSIMPEGLASNLTVQEFSSLIAYLESLRSKK
ncbi:MAG TPA: PVC-type heme-binding CxxCH protein [Gemmataceae bacterium]|nr:PVC-type heme-binding CxxCH protein [Gemmataceae bacterium]